MYQLPGKRENSSFLTQIYPKNGFRFGISKNESQKKNQHPQDLGLDLRKLISKEESTSSRYCVYARVCRFSGKTNSFDFFSPNFPKNGFRIGSSKNCCQNNNQYPQNSMCANF